MKVNTLILGAGAAGLFCAAHAGPNTLVIDHAKAPGEKIRISGGGRCNFTNLHASPENYISHNPHFAKSALARYSQWDFIDLIARHNIPWHEKTLGQLFCDRSAKDIIAMLLAEVNLAGAKIWLSTAIADISHDGTYFKVSLTQAEKTHIIHARNLVVATGGKSIPKMGATGIAYQIADQFGLNVIPPRPGLVPFTFPDGRFKNLAGVSLDCRVNTQNGTSFQDGVLFTHRGLSGPAILQSSSYWSEGEEIILNLFPQGDLVQKLQHDRSVAGKKRISNTLAQYVPARLAAFLADQFGLSGNIGDLADTRIQTLTDAFTNWRLLPSGTEGYRTAEVTLGGVDTRDLSSKTMEAKPRPGLYFIGEAVDVTGWLGGYNFQWAWASAFAAGTAISISS